MYEVKEVNAAIDCVNKAVEHCFGLGLTPGAFEFLRDTLNRELERIPANYGYYPDDELISLHNMTLGVIDAVRSGVHGGTVDRASAGVVLNLVTGLKFETGAEMSLRHIYF